MRKSLLPLLASVAMLATPAIARDFILAPARPDKLIVVDAQDMKVVNTITVEDAGPTPMVPIVAPTGNTPIRRSTRQKAS